MIDFGQFEHSVLLVGLGVSETANFQVNFAPNWICRVLISSNGGIDELWTHG